MLSEKSQTQKTTCCMIPFIQNVQNRQIYRDGKYICGCLGLGNEGEMESDLTVTDFLFWDDDCGDGCTIW